MPLTRSSEMENMDQLVSARDTSLGRRQQRNTKDVILKAIKSLEKAIGNLKPPSDDVNIDMEKSMLDAIIYISFMILELELF